MNLENIVKKASEKLKNHNIHTHELDAQIILSDIMKIKREFLITNNKMYIPEKVLKGSNTGRHKIIDTECNSGKIKVLSHSSKEIPSGSVFLAFDKKYTYAYGDSWIIE